MTREGVFADVDAALTWHPGTQNEVMVGTNQANIQAAFTFRGRASHAAAAPQNGRSALDAVELMDVGVNYLREHMADYERVHYAILDTGGVSPNVVQPKAEVLYLVRSRSNEETRRLYDRVVNIARGAALMTETELAIRFDKAYPTWCQPDPGTGPPGRHGNGGGPRADGGGKSLPEKIPGPGGSGTGPERSRHGAFPGSGTPGGTDPEGSSGAYILPYQPPAPWPWGLRTPGM